MYFRLVGDFDADNEVENSSIGNKTTNIYRQNPVFVGYTLVSELIDVLKSGYYEAPFGYNIVDWLLDEVIKLKNRVSFWLNDTKKDIIMTKEDEEHFKNNNICRFCETEIIDIKVRDHCHLTGK